MKKVNKIISSVMVIIMLITASPVLQAAEFSTTLDRTELNELRKEISSSVQDGWLKAKKISYDGIPDVQTIEKRYAEARKNYKQNLESFTKNSKEQDREAYERYLEFLKGEAKKRIESESYKYDGFKTQKEKEQVAFFTVLLEEMKGQEDIRKEYYNQMAGSIFAVIYGSVMVGMLSYIVIEDLGLFAANSSTGIMASGILGVITAIVISVLADPSKPYFDLNLFPDELIAAFLEKPFYNLSMFNAGCASDFEIFYNKSKESAQLLYDAVDIEYYISLNPGVENMKARLYTQTIDWYNLDTETQLNYIHNLAERLRAEADTNENTK